jgi:hypothetical protein
MGRKHSALAFTLFVAFGALMLGAPSAMAVPPANDNFASAQVVGPALPISVAGTTTEATFQAPDEPDHLDAGTTGLQSVWYSWTPGSSGTFSVNTCDGDAPGTAVYQGASLSTLTLVGGGLGDCIADFVATGSQTYHIAVAAFFDADFTLDITSAGTIIDNDVVQLGVRPEGHLNVPGTVASSGEGTNTVGIRYLPTNADSVSPGCECEGWGAADATSQVTGYANQSTDSGPNNMTLVNFTSDADSATSVVDIGTTLRVTHDYQPSTSPNLYAVTVTIENISGAPVVPRYRRVMDWDVEPTAFSEFVTVGTGAATDLIDADNDGFATANPLGADGTLGNVDPLFTGGFLDQGAYDHGSRFDFGFASLAPSATKAFTIYYGAAANEASAISALDSVNAEVYSIGEPDTTDGPTLGTPNTFVFGFSGVGGEEIGDAPNTTITSGPSGATNSTNPTFAYTGGAGTDHFVCQLSGPDITENLATCPPAGKSYSGLSDGDYTFRVAAVSAGGSTDPSPASRTFIIDTTSGGGGGGGSAGGGGAATTPAPAPKAKKCKKKKGKKASAAAKCKKKKKK